MVDTDTKRICMHRLPLSARNPIRQNRKKEQIQEYTVIMVDDDENEQIEVEAPSDLEEGYLLDVELNGEVRTVIVVRSNKLSLEPSPPR